MKRLSDRRLQINIEYLEGYYHTPDHLTNDRGNIATVLDLPQYAYPRTREQEQTDLAWCVFALDWAGLITRNRGAEMLDMELRNYRLTRVEWRDVNAATAEECDKCYYSDGSASAL